MTYENIGNVTMEVDSLPLEVQLPNDNVRRLGPVGKIWMQNAGFIKAKDHLTAQTSHSRFHEAARSDDANMVSNVDAF